MAEATPVSLLSVLNRSGDLRSTYQPADSVNAGEDSSKKALIDGPWSTTEHGKKAEMKLEKNPCDVESWSVLIREAQVRRMNGRIREL